MRSWIRVRRDGAFGASAQVFSLFNSRNKFNWYVSKPAWIRTGHVSMRARVAFGAGSRGVHPSAVLPPPRYPSCDYSRHCQFSKQIQRNKFTKVFWRAGEVTIEMTFAFWTEERNFVQKSFSSSGEIPWPYWTRAVVFSKIVLSSRSLLQDGKIELREFGPSLSSEEWAPFGQFFVCQRGTLKTLTSFN